MATLRASTRLSLEIFHSQTRCLNLTQPLRQCRNLRQPTTSCPRRAVHTPPPAKAPLSKPTPKRPTPGNPKTARVAIPLTAAGAGLLSLFTFSLWQISPPSTSSSPPSPASNPSSPSPAAPSDRDPSLPLYRLSHIRTHDSTSPEPWVTHRDRVYDITSWIPAHPGGDVILRAAGGSIDPYWAIFTIHQSPHVKEILDQFLIGYIHPDDLVDGLPARQEIEDPFKGDPERDGRLVTHTERPRNAEPPGVLLGEEWITEGGVFYVRNHMWVPDVKGEEGEGVDEGKYILTVELPDGEERRYTLEELKKRFNRHEVTVTLQCSGNRRNDMTRHAGRTNGLQWGTGAISNAVWEGVRLGDVLRDAGLRVVDPALLTATDAKGKGEGEEGKGEEEGGKGEIDASIHHVQFSGLEAYGASIPLPTALDPRGDVLLAWGMNGGPLPRDHGYPLRGVVPGHVAARSVKWLSKVTVSDEESTSQWQRRDYKSFGPNEGADPDWEQARAIQEMPVTSAVTRVWVGDAVGQGRVKWLREGKMDKEGVGKEEAEGKKKGVVDVGAVARNVGFTSKTSSSEGADPVAVQGYAYSGGGREITRVDISLDGGKTWDQADLVDDWNEHGAKGSKHWAWKRWRYLGQLPDLQSLPASSVGNGKDGEKKCTEIVVKATDDAYNTQPEHMGSIYNVRGNLATAWHRVKVCGTCRGEGKGVCWKTAETYGCGFEEERDEVREHMRGAGAE